MFMFFCDAFFTKIFLLLHLMVLTCLTLSGSGAVVGDDLPGHTVLGCNNIIGHHAVVGVKCQDLKYKVSFKVTLNVNQSFPILT